MCPCHHLLADSAPARTITQHTHRTHARRNHAVRYACQHVNQHRKSTRAKQRVHRKCSPSMPAQSPRTRSHFGCKIVRVHVCARVCAWSSGYLQIERKDSDGFSTVTSRRSFYALLGYLCKGVRRPCGEDHFRTTPCKRLENCGIMTISGDKNGEKERKGGGRKEGRKRAGKGVHTIAMASPSPRDAPVTQTTFPPYDVSKVATVWTPTATVPVHKKKERKGRRKRNSRR